MMHDTVEVARVALLVMEASVEAEEVRQYRPVAAPDMAGQDGVPATEPGFLTREGMVDLLSQLPKPVKCDPELQRDTLIVHYGPRPDWIDDTTILEVRQFERDSLAEFSPHGVERLLLVHRDHQLLISWEVWSAFRADYVVEFTTRPSGAIPPFEDSGADVVLRLTFPLKIELFIKADQKKGKKKKGKK